MDYTVHEVIRVRHDGATFTFTFHLVHCLPQTWKQAIFQEALVNFSRKWHLETIVSLLGVLITSRFVVFPGPATEKSYKINHHRICP